MCASLKSVNPSGGSKWAGWAQASMGRLGPGVSGPAGPRRQWVGWPQASMGLARQGLAIQLINTSGRARPKIQRSGQDHKI